jgi:hypothetical protein
MQGTYKNIYGTPIYITGVRKEKKTTYVTGHTDTGAKVYITEAELKRWYKKVEQ